MGSAADSTALAVQFIAVLQRDSNGAPPFDKHLLHAGVHPDLHSQGSSRTGNCSAYPARAALCEAPGAECAVNLAHVMMQQHIRGARASAGPGKCR